ncbi:hypothetical protein JNUCC1_00789 [Lentibacillus sp. JNUCC-1]|uniref:DUF4127 family protein n=1 Tax=Lentibacillus sp. JNUCC-1 TaxID=2654513 RepID=UPI0012E80AD4|nr:DUF4127 family protein [Lentibacillus sp. JNUCC-1]MUV36983.1 hypothetical protein [Lentibacillus sp. JNUCC-1]
MKIIYLPLDERPCNTVMVERIAATAREVTIQMPPRDILGRKKRAADIERLWEWVQQEVQNCDALILSIDMLMYGGLLPSRLHEFKEDMVPIMLNRLRELLTLNPELPVYAFSLIMRTPQYSSSDEEPDYYEHWGGEIFLRAFLEDKSNNEELTDEELCELKDIQQRLPSEHVTDYETRRRFNVAINMGLLDLVHEGILNCLVIPQDDSAIYGYTAIDQKAIYQKRAQLGLEDQVLIYPGADEVGATLLARAYNELSGYTTKIYPVWSSPLGPEIIPMYEDRPFLESLNSHVLAAGCKLVESPETADLILAYNTPGGEMQESWEQSGKHHTYVNDRNMSGFVKQLKNHMNNGKKVIVADSAYANGGDFELINLMDKKVLLDSVLSYKGWNTNCNTLGSTISQGVLGLNGDPEKIQENVLYHVLDDYLYQAEIRMEMTADFLPSYDLSYFDLKDQADLVCRERDQRLLQRLNSEILYSFENLKIEELKTWAPWNRMFECGLKLVVRFPELE